MAADKAKSVEQSMGEMRGLVYFINRVNRLSSTKTYIEFWNDWKTRNLESRKAIILNSIKNNTDEGMVLAIENIGYDKIEEMLSEQAGIKNIVEPELRIYENSFACMKFQNSPKTEGFYEIHRVLVGNIEYRL